jgi:ABC-type dipeptide/oligopeptide/nickel transport systems, permease components
MVTYVIRRVIQAIPILIGIAIISFLIVHLAPGSPIDKFRTPRVSTEQLNNLIRMYGLDKSIPEQFLSWISSFFQVWKTDNQGHFIAWGFSFTDGRPILEKVVERIPATMLLMGTALATTVVIAIPVGVLAAVKQYSIADKVITVLATVGYALPSYWLGIMLLYIFAIDLNLFPLYGMHTLGGSDDLPDLAWHMVLPVASLTIQSVAGWSRYMRASMLEVMRQDYIRTARAKGLPPSRVITKHALRNALIPIVTLLGLTIPTLLSGAVITEAIFGWPGLGNMGYQAVIDRDYPLVLAFVMIGGAMVILGNLIADILYAVVDPRIKY